MATYNDGLVHYNDDAARTAGEAITVDLGTTYTIRTDTRWHANAPASMTGSHGSLTPTNGLINIDATNVRWLAYNTGSGVVPAIGTSITQGAVSGYLLGVWANLTSAPTAVGAAMPATGYIKFREVTGGAYAAGALTGIGASATGADVGGWIEVVCDSAANITVPRLGEFRTRGGWFELPQTTDGTVGQVIQIPTNGGGAGTAGVGLWIETGVGTGEYDYWPSLYPTTTGNWHVWDLGGPYSATDARASFVKDIGSGQMQIGEAYDMSGTYEALSQTGTYATTSISGTYTWDSDKVTVTVTAGHFLHDGESVYLTFSTGDAVGSDGVYAITMLDLYTFTVDLVGNGAGGNVTGYTEVRLTLNAHVLGIGDKIYCNFTSGSGVSGEYTIRTVVTTNRVGIDYTPSSSVSGNVTAWAEYRVHMADLPYLWDGAGVYLDFTSGAGTDGVYTALSPRTAIEYSGTGTYAWSANVVTVTKTTHNHRVGDSVYLDFTSGGATGNDGVYVVVTVPTTSTFTVALAGSGASGNVTDWAASFRINAHNSGLADSGNVTVKRTIGHIPPSGCKIRIPNILMREAATATRASNMVNAVVASRPEFITTASGQIDMEYAYSTWWHIFEQAYSIRLYHSATIDRLYFTETGSPVDIDDSQVSTYLGAALNNLYISTLPSGGTIKNVKALRGGNTITAHACVCTYTSDLTFENCTFGNIAKFKSSGANISTSDNYNFVFTNCRTIGGSMTFGYVDGLIVNNLDYCVSFTGKTNSVYGTYAHYATHCKNLVYDGLTFGFGGTIPDVSPYLGVSLIGASVNGQIKNIGTKASPLQTTSYRWNYYGVTNVNFVSANNVNIKHQRIYLDKIRGIGLNTVNTDDGMIYQNVYASDYLESQFSNQANYMNALNGTVSGCRFGLWVTAGQTSVYGTHFCDYFLGDTLGALVLYFNEPTTDTVSQYTVVAGTPKWNGAGGLLMETINDQVIFEDSIFRLGYTGFQNVAPTMNGGTITNYTLEYDIDIGSGYSGSWTALTGANLSAITVDPAIGFKMKYRITTINTNTSAITCLSIKATSTAAAQANQYPLDYYTLTVSGLETGTKVAFVETGTETSLQDVATESSGEVSYTFPDSMVGDGIDIKILCAGYEPLTITNYILTAENLELPITLSTDYGYDNTKTADVTFVHADDQVVVDSGITEIDVKGVYREWVDWALTGENLTYLQMMYSVGGNDIDTSAGTTIPVYVYLINGTTIKPDDANHKLVVSGGIVLTEDGSDPFATSPGYTVKVCFQQPVNAIGVIDQSALASAVLDAMTADHVISGSVGEKIGKKLLDKGTFIALG